MDDNSPLRVRARELGVQTSYFDVADVLHEAEDAALERIVEVLEADRAAAGSVATVAGSVEEAPGDSWMPRDHALARSTAIFAPAYALWERDRPLPSFGHLHELARTAKANGIDVVSTLPLYTTFLDEPFDPSPYSPVSRLHWNEVYLDDADLPDAPVPELGELVEWRVLAERRRAQLIAAARDADDELIDDLDAFATEHPDVADFARFQTTRSGGDQIVARSHVLAQFLADRQLGAITDDPDAASLSLDLPIGSHPHGFETWRHPELFAGTMNVGAPPDAFFADGQDWGFPPPLPAANAANDHQLWRDLIMRVGRHTDVLRIDHAMAVERLWWVPQGFPAHRGAYVHYPREDILAVIASAATAAGVTIVGEDLGTVPAEVSEAFDRWDMLGMYEEQFHVADDPLPHIPWRTVAGVRTHDMAPLAEAVRDLDTAGYRTRVGAAHGTRVADTWQDVLEHMLLRLSYSEAFMVVVDVDDLLGELRPHNLPGRVVPEIWRRRLDRPTSETFADPDVLERLALLRRGR